MRVFVEETLITKAPEGLHAVTAIEVGSSQIPRRVITQTEVGDRIGLEVSGGGERLSVQLPRLVCAE